jgi:hypothetical protein
MIMLAVIRFSKLYMGVFYLTKEGEEGRGGVYPHWVLFLSDFRFVIYALMKHYYDKTGKFTKVKGASS